MGRHDRTPPFADHGERLLRRGPRWDERHRPGNSPAWQYRPEGAPGDRRVAARTARSSSDGTHAGALRFGVEAACSVVLVYVCGHLASGVLLVSFRWGLTVANAGPSSLGRLDRPDDVLAPTANPLPAERAAREHDCQRHRANNRREPATALSHDGHCERWSPASMRASPQMTAGWAATADGPARICPPRADPSARTASENTDVAGYCSAMGYRPPTAIGTFIPG